MPTDFPYTGVVRVHVHRRIVYEFAVEEEIGSVMGEMDMHGVNNVFHQKFKWDGELTTEGLKDRNTGFPVWLPENGWKGQWDIISNQPISWEEENQTGRPYLGSVQCGDVGRGGNGKIRTGSRDSSAFTGTGKLPAMIGTLQYGLSLAIEQSTFRKGHSSMRTHVVRSHVYTGGGVQEEDVGAVEEFEGVELPCGNVGGEGNWVPAVVPESMRVELDGRTNVRHGTYCRGRGSGLHSGLSDHGGDAETRSVDGCDW